MQKFRARSGPAPYRIVADGSRHGMLRLFEGFARENFDPEEVKKLRRQALVCHCLVGVPCHADVLLNLAEELVKDKMSGSTGFHEFLEDGMHVRMAEVIDKTQNDAVEGIEEQGDRNAWKGWLGDGPPRRAPFMGRSNPFADGGVCALQEGGSRVGDGSRRGARIGS